MSKKEDLRYTLDRLYECINLEITNLWQRSVFLSVFLILCYTGYGYLALELIDENVFSQKINISSSIVANIGLIFSAIWIFMCKAPKAWYEVYETAIVNFEKKYNKEILLPKSFIMGNMPLPKKK